MLGKRAIVVGGSIGGILAARVLSDHFEEVMVIERDSLTGDGGPRKGAPQGRNVHVMFGGGARVIDGLFPGFFTELVARGSVVCDFAKDLCWYHGGVWKARPESALVSYWQSRPFLEAHLLDRLQRDTRVRVLDRHKVIRLTADDSRTRVTGVEIGAADADARTEMLASDLVVDAAGRGSAAPKWLETLGYDPPKEMTVEVDIGYASRMYAPSPKPRDWQVMALYGSPPHSKRTGYIFPIEGGRWLVSLVGFHKDYPPDTDEAFLAFARSLELPDFHEALRDAQPLTPATAFRFPANRWRRFDRLTRFPQGFLAIGDSISSFNPVYGQGMSVCALEVDVLRRLFERSESQGRIGGEFAQAFFRETAAVVGIPWLLATQSDFLYPETRGRRPLITNPLNWYLKRVLQLCSGDERIVRTFYEVLHFLRKPTALFQPYVLGSVLWRAAGGRRGVRGSRTRPGPGTRATLAKGLAAEPRTARIE
jgi:2-polyprenyl-6-methoxyphenol hydroxylase-like FAD-dependent oxidoreductase